MREIYFKEKKYTKIFSGYKFSDTDIEAMNGYYPEIIESGKPLKKKDVFVIRLTNVNDIIEQLSTKKNSILMKNVLGLNNNIIVSELIGRLEEVLIELSVG